MNSKFAAVCCLAAYVFGCASPERAPQTVMSARAPATRAENAPDQSLGKATLAQRADHFAGRLRDRAAQVPAKAQGVLDTVGDSQLVTCMIPVLIVGGVVFAFLGGGPIGPLNFSVPAASSS
jgi:hypothetical protein